eukprot:TRINITY_DN2266_c0_g1_i1.p1 TRINITY_DN2266_c0_g1~~TRINITY_DN2266_c0_g1_i1.p1  ORF type:complete len:923 (-),score=247.56 TRINITY_DN2266_c0_g1_i1:189-2903(-)
MATGVASAVGAGSAELSAALLAASQQVKAPLAPHVDCAAAAQRPLGGVGGRKSLRGHKASDAEAAGASSGMAAARAAAAIGATAAATVLSTKCRRAVRGAAGAIYRGQTAAVLRGASAGHLGPTSQSSSSSSRPSVGATAVRCTATATAVPTEKAVLRLGEDGRFQGEFSAGGDPYLKRRLEAWDRLWEKSEMEAAGKAKTPIQITLPDGSVKEGTSFETTPLDIAAGISKGLATNSVMAFVEYVEPVDASCQCVAADGDEDDSDEEAEASKALAWDLTRPLQGSCRLELVKFDDPRGRETFWHSSSHVMGAALENRFGGLLTIGPAVDGGFYYDMFLGDRRISEADYKEIEKEVEALRQKDLPFQRMVLSREDALELFADNPFKVSLIERKVEPGSLTSAYRCGDLIDLCRGPHLPSTGRVKAFAVTKNSSAYWLGSADNDSLQRVYGVSFPSSKELKLHMKRMEEAKERDHRNIGTKQDLFFFNANVSPGSCFWTTHGTRIYNRLQELMRAEYRKRGFDEVITPNIYASELFKRSGHYQNYREDMYGFKVEGQEWFLKPMNCPGHCVVFDSKPRSYRELPLRMASFGVLHRNELSGTLSGLTRVRRFQQDDAHIFAREDQIRSEVSAALQFVFDIYELFGFEFNLSLSTRPKKALGSEELWERAEEQLKEALEGTGKKWNIKKGDGAFYGPKIDIALQDALGRGHQCGTIQLDFQLPLRFNLRYQSEAVGDAEAAAAAPAPAATGDGSAEAALPPGYSRPVILHRAILGSVERMVGVLAEHFGGKWPFWLSPRQCMVVPVSDDAFGYAKYVRDTLHSHGFHAEADLSKKRMQKKVREAQVDQWNYIMVVGKEEEERTCVNLRMRGETKPVGERDLAELIAELEAENTPLSLRRPKALEPYQR